MCVSCVISKPVFFQHPSEGAFYDVAKNLDRIPENYKLLNIMYYSPLFTATW